MPLLVRSAAVCALVALLAGCGGGSSAPGSLLPASSSGGIAPQRASAPQITVSPGQLQFAAAGAAAQTFVADLTQGGGQLDAATSNAQCATVNPGSARSGSTFTVTPVGAGTCSITVSNKKGASASVTITVAAPAPTPMPANTPAVVHQYAIPASNESYGITSASNGSVWYTEWYNGAAGAMSPTGGNANYPIGGTPYGVAQGSDGNLWISDHANNAIDVMSSSGAMIAQYSTPYTPMSVTAGPDHNVWFTAEDASGATGFSEVVQITPTGAMTAFATSPAAQAAGRYASSIVAGSDGRLWFTEGNYIGAVTTSGVMTEYPVPSGRSTNFITAGPDGNLWFSEEYGGYVGRISTNGIAQEYAVPTLFADPWMLAPGKDGAVWFTEAGGTAQIGRVDANGTVREYPIANLSGNPAILAGSDGNLWIPSANGQMYVVSY
jgi:streptogramin lyase